MLRACWTTPCPVVPPPNEVKCIGSFKFGGFYRRMIPKPTRQVLGLPVHAPERAYVPSQTLAHGPQYARSDLLDRGRFRQDLRDGVLHAEAFLCALALGDLGLQCFVRFFDLVDLEIKLLRA